MDRHRRTRDDRVPARPRPIDRPAAEVEIVEIGGHGPARSGRPGTRTALAAGIAVLALLVAVVGLSGGEPGPSPDPAARASGTDRTTEILTAPPIIFPTGKPGATPFPWGWTELELRGYGRGSSVRDLWVLDGLFVAHLETDEGPDGGPFGPVSSVLLASADGTTWTDDAVDLPERGFVIDVGTVADGRLYVLGRSDGSELRQLWSTADGAWRREPDPIGLAAAGQGVVELAASPIGWVAIVAVERHHDVEDIRVSPDGVAWAAPRSLVERESSLSSLAWVGDAWHVLATADGDAPGINVVEVLRTTDLESWSIRQVFDGPGGPRDLAGGVAGPALAGSIDDAAGRRPVVWLVSTAGDWVRFDLDMVPGRPPATLDHIVATERGYLAMSRTTGDAWLSTDGVAWRNLPAFHAESGDTIRAVVSAGDVLVAAGRSASGRPTLWRGLLSVQLAVP